MNKESRERVESWKLRLALSNLLIFQLTSIFHQSALADVSFKTDTCLQVKMLPMGQYIYQSVLYKPPTVAKSCQLANLRQLWDVWDVPFHPTERRVQASTINQFFNNKSEMCSHMMGGWISGHLFIRNGNFKQFR